MKEIIELNNARFGSFSEFVFENIFESEKIVRKHFDRVDFKLNGTDVDIKGKKNFGIKYKTSSKYNGKKIEGIRYIVVEFFENIVVISEEKDILKIIDYSKINSLFSKWIGEGRKKSTKIKPDLKIIKNMKKEITEFFISKNLSSKIIYRTCQESFGNESPDNLLPKEFSKTSVTIFLNFNDHKVNYDNFKEIIAFRNSDACNFKFIDKPRLHMKKLDLGKIDHKYKFKTIKELISKWN